MISIVGALTKRTQLQLCTLTILTKWWEDSTQNVLWSLVNLIWLATSSVFMLQCLVISGNCKKKSVCLQSRSSDCCNQLECGYLFCWTAEVPNNAYHRIQSGLYTKHVCYYFITYFIHLERLSIIAHHHFWVITDVYGCSVMFECVNNRWELQIHNKRSWKCDIKSWWKFVLQCRACTEQLKHTLISKYLFVNSHRIFNG